IDQESMNKTDNTIMNIDKRYKLIGNHISDQGCTEDHFFGCEKALPAGINLCPSGYNQLV
ncbi:MAG TPA: hypothetical protein PLA02_10385, partial [Brevefilum fermentans]|nr:hypothetical protein [Brevefilum fermentans]